MPLSFKYKCPEVAVVKAVYMTLSLKGFDMFEEFW